MQFAQISYAEINGYLRDTLLRDVDAMSMAHSLEVRPVLLDHELAEYVFALPGSFKLRHGQLKRVLVDAVHDLLPPGTIKRRKMGFELPLTDWLRTSLRARARELLAGDVATPLFVPKFLRRLEAQLEQGVGHDPLPWAVVMLLGYTEHLRLTAP